MGVMELTVPIAGGVTHRQVRQLAGLVAALLVTRNRYGDAFKVARRVEDMSVAAEMQWQLLPSPTFSDGRVTITGVLEPSYRVAGDTFDYASNGECLHLAVIDAMGHGFEATVMATVAIGVYRHARRRGHGLAVTYAAIDDAIVRQFGIDRFVTGQLVQLNTHTGLLRWLNAGHPPPLLARGDSLLPTSSCGPSRRDYPPPRPSGAWQPPCSTTRAASCRTTPRRCSSSGMVGSGSLPRPFLRAGETSPARPCGFRREAAGVLSGYGRFAGGAAADV